MESLKQETTDEWQPECSESKAIMDSRCGECSNSWLCVRTTRINLKLLNDER